MTKFLIPFQKEGKWGYKDKDGNVVIPPKLQAAGEFSLGIAQIQINNQIQYIDYYGTILDVNQLQPRENYYDEITDSADELVRFKENQRHGYKNIKNYHNEITDSADELVRFKENQRHGYKNTKGKVIIPPIYVAAFPFSEGIALVKLDFKWGYINSKGKVIIDFIYDFADSFSQGIARVMLDKKYGYINCRGEEIIPICYDELDRFNQEIAFFKWGKKRGYINRSGEVVTPTNQNSPKKEKTILKSKSAKGDSRKTTKQQLENLNHLKGRRKRKRTNSKLNDENIL